MSKYKIAVLPGDGVGKDVIEASQSILDKIALDAEYIHGDVGWEFWKSEGDPLPERTIKLLRESDAALFGAITSKPRDEAEEELNPELKGKGLVYFSPIVRMRQLFNLKVNFRPCKAYKGNPLNYKDGIDITVFRENTEGLYSGIEYHPVPDNVWNILLQTHKKAERFKDVPLEDMAISVRLFTRNGCQNIVRAAFEYAKKHNYPTVTVVEKPNVLRETSGLMVREARKIQKENFPEIDLWEANIDAMTMWLIKNPLDYSVLVAGNMFGDIISDLCAQLVGGLGFACSGNIGDDLGIFEPTHGSAPKYAGQYKVNPIAMILSIKLMCNYLGETNAAEAIDMAVASVIEEGKIKTYDMGGSSTSIDVAKAVAERI
jgi:isocitrate/isopropylmalate dehydrogenase